MDALGSLWLVAKFVLLLAGLLVPGAALMRALRLPVLLATSFAGSVVAIYVTIVALQFTGVGISLVSLTIGLSIISVVARLVRGGTGTPRVNEPTLLSRAGLQGAAGMLGVGMLLYAVFWCIVLWRAWHEPLAGPDIEFRWSFLAEQMLRHGSLDFYPPRSADDFLKYFWAESIPPGVSALHAWAYACAGEAVPRWTVPGVVLQIVALHELIGRTAQRIAGNGAAAYALIAAAACPLLTWSVLLGQETGLTALALLGIAFAMSEWRQNPSIGWAVLAGIFATLGASAREYGGAFLLIGAATLAVMRADRRAWLGFAVAAALGLIWPLRTWVLTGNPFYSLDLAGLFPVNPRFLAWVQHDADAFAAPLHSATGWATIVRYGCLFAPAALLGIIAATTALVRRQRDAAWLMGGCATVFLLWAASVRYTNGGLFYSLRVLAPALALGVLAAGIALAKLTATASRSGAVLAAALLLLTLPATLALPQNPWRAPRREWPAFSRPTMAADPTLVLLTSGTIRIMPSSVVLADAPGFQRRFLDAGFRVMPLWSPAANWLFDASLPSAEAIRQWRKSGVRHLVVTKWQTNIDFLNRHSRWGQPPFVVQMVGETASTAVFSIGVRE